MRGVFSINNDKMNLEREMRDMGGLSILIIMGLLTSIFLFFMAIFLFIVIYTVISYIFESMAVVDMSRHLGYKQPYRGWIPFYNKYLLSKIANCHVIEIIVSILSFVEVLMAIYMYTQGTMNILLLILFILLLSISFILDTIVAYKILKRVSEKYCDLFIVINVLTLGIFRPILLFILRNRLNDETSYKSENI